MDFFDDDFDIEGAAIIGGFFGMVDEEEEDERQRRKLERQNSEDPLNDPEEDAEFEEE